MTQENIDPEVAKLEAEKLAAEKALADTATVKGVMIPKSRFDEVNIQKKEALEALDSIASGYVEEVPEEMRHLIPDLPPLAKVHWIRAALKENLFRKPLEQGLDTRRPGGKVPLDLNGMDAHSLRKMGYKK